MARWAQTVPPVRKPALRQPSASISSSRTAAGARLSTVRKTGSAIAIDGGFRGQLQCHHENASLDAKPAFLPHAHVRILQLETQLWSRVTSETTRRLRGRRVGRVN